MNVVETKTSGAKGGTETTTQQKGRLVDQYEKKVTKKKKKEKPEVRIHFDFPKRKLLFGKLLLAMESISTI